MHKSLFDILGKREGSRELLFKLDEIRKIVTPELAQIGAPGTLFEGYTPHDIGHKERVLENYKLIIPQSLADRFGKYEIFFLIAATYFHDIGMIDWDGFDKPDGYNTWSKENKAEYVRDIHHVRSEQYVRDLWMKNWPTDNQRQAEIIGRIAKGHRSRVGVKEEDLHQKQFFDYEETYNRELINVPLLCALLKLADELDFAFDRTPMILYEHFPPKEDLSKFHWNKHIITDPPITIGEQNLTIMAKARCPNPKLHRALKRMESKINEQIRDLENHLHSYFKLPIETRNGMTFRYQWSDLPKNFELRITADGYEPYDFKFTLAEKQIINLLMGEKFYSSQFDSLREILKNSVDACRRRSDLFRPQEALKIEFSLSDDYTKLEVKDNGYGMDRFFIERYLTQIGNSFYVSDDFKEENHHFRPVGELGIGLLSYFLIADKIVIDTKAEHSDALQIEISDLSDFFFVQSGKRTEQGTTVTLFIKDKVKQSLNDVLLEHIERYARFIEFPVFVRSNHKTFEIRTKDPITRLDDLMSDDKYPGLERKSFGAITIRVNTPEVSGIIVLQGGKNSKNEFIPGYPIFSIGPHGIHHVSNQGIYVGLFDLLPFWLAPEMVYSDLNIKNAPIDLDIDRNSIVRNKKFFDIQKILGKIVVKELVKKINQMQKEKVRPEIINGFSEYFRRYYPIPYDVPRDEFDRMMRESYTEITPITKNLYERCILNGKFEWLRISDVGKNTVKILQFGETDSIYLSDSKNMEIIKKCGLAKKGIIYLMRAKNAITGEIYKYPSEQIAEYYQAEVDRHELDFVYNHKDENSLAPILPTDHRSTKMFENYLDRKGEVTAGLNLRHPFLAFLVNHKEILVRGTVEMSVKLFFRSIGEEIRNDPCRAPRIHLHNISFTTNYEQMLAIMLEKGVISSKQRKEFELTKQDIEALMWESFYSSTATSALNWKRWFNQIV